MTSTRPTNASNTRNRIGTLATSMILERLRKQGISSSTKIIIDFLGETERTAIFEHMLELSKHEVEIFDPEASEPHRLRAICGEDDKVVIIPFFVLRGELDKSDTHTNRGSEGFASRLRDFFAAKVDEETRVLLVFTNSGNETQKSARDGGVDQGIVTLEGLTDRLLEAHGFVSDPSMQRVRDVYLDTQRPNLRNGVAGTLGWSDVLETLNTYLGQARALPPERRGECLSLLGCFMKDSSETFATGEDEIELATPQDRQRFGKGRLETNAGNFITFSNMFLDPLVNEVEKFQELFEKNTADQFISAGLGKLGELDVTQLKRRPSTNKRSKFDLEQLQIEHAGTHHLIPSTPKPNKRAPILLISAPSSVEVEVGLTQEIDRHQEHPRLLWYESGRKRPKSGDCRIAPDGMSIKFKLEGRDQFHVYQLVLAKGPRSYKSLYDELTIAVYPSNEAVVAREVGGRLLKQHHAWARDGEVCAFALEGDDSSISRVQREKMDLLVSATEADADLESEELDEGHIQELRRTVLVGDLSVRVAWTEATPPQNTEESVEVLEQTLYTNDHNRKQAADAFFKAAKSHETYLGAADSVSWDPDLVWKVSYPPNLILQVRSSNEHGQESATGALLEQPDIMRLVRTHDGILKIDRRFDTAIIAHFEEFFAIRKELFGVLASVAPHYETSQVDEQQKLIGERFTSLLLADLIPHASLIEQYLDQWIRAADFACAEQTSFDANVHGVLLTMDQLEHRDENNELVRLSILPTHPWLLSALLDFQKRINDDIRQATRRSELHIQPHELSQLYPNQIIEDWFHRTDRAHHLKAEDGTPFHWEYLTEALHRQEARLDYVTSLVRHKIHRYMRMHPHLQDAKRTLRVGFLNPGDASQLFDGIRQWFGEQQRDTTSSFEEWLERFPTIEVHLFGREDDDIELLGARFDRFFEEYAEDSASNVTDQAMLSKIRYRKRLSNPGSLPMPRSESEYVHICFAMELIQSSEYEALDKSIQDGWDGCFAQGLLATTLRQSNPGIGNANGVSVRGLWLGPSDHPRPHALMRLMALVRGAKTSQVDPNLGIYWQVPLPSMSELKALYLYSDWVVHLDRELSIEMFNRDDSTIIEYSDQADPQNPGYDVITVTRHADPYLHQLESVLKATNLVSSKDMGPSNPEQWRNTLLSDLNALSGTWALDFLEGNIAIDKAINRLKGHIGCALVYRWLKQVELPALQEELGQRLVPVCMSLEEIIRATPVGGHGIEGGLAHRSKLENRTKHDLCDDLLVLYLTPAKKAREYKIYGRIIEVKFGKTALSAKSKAIRQVKNTNETLRRYLGGKSDRLDAIFRHKQLSLIIKERVEQARARGEIDKSTEEALNLPLLSANLATGTYTIDYSSSSGTMLCYGDAFLLSTDSIELEEPLEAHVTADDGVRIVTLGGKLLEWLAFASENEQQSISPRTTFPNLGEPSSSLGDYFDSVVSEEPQDVSVESNENQQSTRLVESGGTRDGEKMPQSPQVMLVDTSANLPEGTEDLLSLEAACSVGLHEQERDFRAIQSVVDRLSEALRGHKISMASPPDLNKVALGPRLTRVFVEMSAGESISSIRRISEDIARHVGTQTPDIHIHNSPKHRAIAFDLPLEDFGYTVTYDELVEHPSFRAAKHELDLGFCAGIEVTGTPLWADLAKMPHMLLAGSTGSGKTVFLRTLLLTMASQHTPEEVILRLASSKEMDFRVFTKLPHVDRDMATNARDALKMADELVREMDRRIEVISDAFCDNITDYNEDPDTEGVLARIVCVIDEFSETVLSFEDRADRRAFEDAVARLAQKARAAGIHLILSMQRPDSTVIQGAVKTNIVHRFALRLPQHQDSSVILGETGAEALLGKGDLLYKDGDGRMHRLQVPNLQGSSMKQHLRRTLKK